MSPKRLPPSVAPDMLGQLSLTLKEMTWLDKMFLPLCLKVEPNVRHWGLVSTRGRLDKDEPQVLKRLTCSKSAVTHQRRSCLQSGAGGCFSPHLRKKQIRGTRLVTRFEEINVTNREETRQLCVGKTRARPPPSSRVIYLWRGRVTKAKQSKKRGQRLNSHWK